MSYIPPEMHSLFIELQKKVSWGKSDIEIQELEHKILRWCSSHYTDVPAQERRERIAYYTQRGLMFKKQWKPLNDILRNDPFDARLAAALSDASLLPEVRERLERKLGKKVLGDADSLYAKGNSAALSRYADKVMAAYPRFKADIQNILEEYAARVAAAQAVPAPASENPAGEELPAVSLPKIDHRLSTRTPQSKWTLWLDETGKDFELTSAGSGQDISIGRFIALLVPPSGVELPPLGANFHATNMPPALLLSHLGTLLAQDCGIFGLSADCLRATQREGWYSLLVETILWSLRLIPLPADGRVEVDIYAETRASFSSPENSEALRHTIARLLGQEKCGSRICLGDVAFKPENTGLLGWADLVANIWGSPVSSKKNILKASGLLGTCLFSDCAPLMNAAKAALQGEALSAEQWHILCDAEDAGKAGSIPFLALEALRETCSSVDAEAYSAAWHPYIMQCCDYLNGRYSMRTAGAEIAWLRHANKAQLSLSDQFFLSICELAYGNHMGDIASSNWRSAVSFVEQHATAMAGLHPQINAKAALRLAVSYANAFDFEKALSLLMPWISEKIDTLNTEMAGKFLSSLGQYAAFCGDSKIAAQCFERAIKQFRKLLPLDEKTASKQLTQTSVYAATNAMDWEEKTLAEVQALMEQALGCSLSEAIHTDRISVDRFLIALLHRYLTARGTKEEKAAMLSRAGSWLRTDRGEIHWPWPLIWYHRTLLAEEAGKADLRQSMAEQLAHCREVNDITIQLIITVLEVALGEADPDEPEYADVLEKARRLMPAAASRIAHVTTSRKGDRSLVKDVLSFNYR